MVLRLLSLSLALLWLILPGSLTAPLWGAPSLARTAVVFSCGVEDSLYSASMPGLGRARTELGESCRVYTCNSNAKKFRSALEAAAKQSNLVIAVGANMKEAVDRLASDYNATHFVLLDGYSSNPAVTSVVFRQNEGSFLAGVLAAMTAKRNAESSGSAPTVGIILAERGAKMPVMLDFLTGFEQGVAHVDKSVTLLKRSVQSFNDPQRAKELALKMHSDGASVIFQAAGASGLGVIDAAIEKGFYVIGVDEAQERRAPGVVLTAVLKRFDKAIFQIIEAHHEGALERGDLMTHQIGNGGVGISWTSNTLIPDEIKYRLDWLTSQIAEGYFTVASAFDAQGNLQPQVEPLSERRPLR